MIIDEQEAAIARDRESRLPRDAGLAMMMMMMMIIYDEEARPWRIMSRVAAGRI
jgi:hypothetical protein